MAHHTIGVALGYLDPNYRGGNSCRPAMCMLLRVVMALITDALVFLQV